MRRLIFHFLICAVIGVLAASTVQAQRSKSGKLTEVKIYLAKTGEQSEEDYDEKNPHNLVAVRRMVDGRFPLRGALIALTGKITGNEERQNLFSPVWGIKFVSVRLKNGTAFTYFTMPEGAAFSGDTSPFIFRDAVEKTAIQFPFVKRVVVCLDGILDFWSESEAPPRKCR